jgi:hypothetical protein
MTYGTKGEPVRCLVSVGPTIAAKASSEGWHLRLRPNSSQVEQVDLDELDDEEAPCIALRNMSIGDVRPKESEEPPQAQDQQLHEE